MKFTCANCGKKFDTEKVVLTGFHQTCRDGERKRFDFCSDSCFVEWVLYDIKEDD